MYIRDIFSNKKPVLSFEVFPPKQESGFENAIKVVDELSKLPIDYMSVTYGAGGSNSKRTAKIASHLINENNIPSLAHLTCVAADKEDIHSKLSEFKEMGIKNVLALRGDIPQGADARDVFTDYKHASDLAADIKDFGSFCIGGACYPEMHPDSKSQDSDIDSLKIKVDMGCDFLVTQMFFDNDAFYTFRDKLLKKGINVPVTAGIMPLTNIGQIQRMAILSGGASMPSKFVRMIAKYENNPNALKQAGIAYAVDQIIDLISNDADGIHLYTMNKPEVAQKIVSVIDSLIR